MKPPPVKVALQVNSGPILVHSRSPVVVQASRSFRETAAPGKIRISTGKVSVSQTDKWLWCGERRDKSAAEDWADKINGIHLNARIQPVGLNLSSGKWSPRKFLLLVRADQPRDVLLERLSGCGLINPRAGFSELVLPRSKPSFELILQDETGRLMRVNEPVQIFGEESLKLVGAPVGEGFHWQHREDLLVSPPLWVDVTANGEICCGTEVSPEDYLMSVNSSEMPADSPVEFLKAQVTAARSWLFANWGSHHPEEPFVVCNGDHCQCYYGESRVRSSSRQAVEETRGELLMYGGTVCDARYAKTCGGVTEPGKNVWDFVDEPYLTHLRDLPGVPPINLTAETAFRAFQKTNDPHGSCCSPGYASLKGECAELTRWYRWKETVTGEELGEIIFNKTGVDVGKPMSLHPVRRGPSGRIIELEVMGEKGSLRLFPELEIRRVLSRTHLPSSAFWIQSERGGVFILHGMGWGHGAGMCQTGAVGLAARGWNYRDILAFYYPSTSIQKIY